MSGEVLNLPIERVHLFDKNPRHGFIADPAKIIERLLKEEQVYELAKSIAEKGTNPLQLIGVVRVDDAADAGEPTYVVWEGNRRVCAIMLLNDPDLAPPAWRKRFEALSKLTDHIDEVEGRVFEDKAVLQFWMRNIHNGTQKGRGRKEWGPDEQHRDNPTKKYAIAFDLLELAEAKGLISPADRKGKLSTLQRFVSQEDLRAILQANDNNPKKVKFGRASADLMKLLKQLVADLLDDDGDFAISSRKNEDQIKAYAEVLEERAGVKPGAGIDQNDDEGGETADDSADEEENDDDDEPAPKPKPPHTIKVDKALNKAINSSGNDKLINLYGSLTKIRATSNSQLIAVGCWSLIETIAAVCGSKDNQSFTAFFNTGMMENTLGFPKKKKGGTIWKALDRFARAGNDTKHHAISGAFNHMELINDMEVVSPMLAKALETMP